MDLLTAILACSVYTSDDALVRAIAQSNSHGNQFAVVDVDAPEDVDASPPPEPKTLEAALARLEDVRGRGGRPLLGWMQLPPAWVSVFGRVPREAFDPCINISIGTAMLSEFDYECETEARVSGAAMPKRRGPARTATSRRACVIRKYANMVGMSDLGLVITLELRYQRPDLPGVPDHAPIETGADSRIWGADRVFLPVSVGPVSVGPDGF